MIVVMPNCRAIVGGDDSSSGDPYRQEAVNGFNNFKNDLKNVLIPYINSNYNTLTGRENTAVAGLSMGGMTTLNIMVSFPELAGYYGAFSSAPNFGAWTDTTLPDQYKDNTFIYITCGTADNLLSQSQTYNQQLNDNGITTTYYEFPDGGHGMNVWKNGLYNFAKRIF